MKSNKLLIGFIIVLSVITIVLIVLLGIALLRGNEKPYEKEESVDTITNEKILTFLDTVTGTRGEPYYNILECVNKDDEELFNLIIDYLYYNDLYTKTEEEYIFKQSDIIKYARKYMLKDNFDYKTQSPDFKYDSKNKTFTTKTYSIKDDSTLIRSIEIYDKTQTTASVRYEVSNVDENFKYNVLIDISNDEYKIIGITKIK